MSEIINSTKQSIARMQAFDVKALPRTDALGRDSDFSAAVEPAEKLISLYKMLSLESLNNFPEQALNSIKSKADSDFKLFDQIMKYTHAEGVPVRDTLIERLQSLYHQTFNVVHPFISFSMSCTYDFQKVESDARALIQGVTDRADALEKELKKKEETVNGILEDIRKTAAEQGVSQQSVYFKESAEFHSGQSDRWFNITIIMTAIMSAYAVASLFIHKIPWLKPESMYESIQLGVSKALIFAVLSYVLYLAGRNFLSHKHNEIVNKHRQNALMTYKALIDAAKEGDVRDTVLNHAASCIFNPQPTGFSKNQGAGSQGATNIIELFTKQLQGGE